MVFCCFQVSVADATVVRIVQSDAAITERQPHEQKIHYTSTTVAEDGSETTVTNSYVQLQTGLNRWDEQIGAFVAASAEIEMINGNGILRNTQHKAIFSRNANDPNGLLELFTPDDQRLVTQPIGIALTEADTGKSVFLAELRDSEAVLLDPHTLIYPNAFDQFKASIAIRSHLHGIESDVILEERIDRALLAEFGINPDTARIEVWHQVLVKPAAEVKFTWLNRGSGHADRDDTIHLNQMMIGPGNAFSIGEQESILPPQGAIPVAKEWVNIETLDFLIESIPFSEAEEALQTLAAPQEARVIQKPRLDDAFAKNQSRRQQQLISPIKDTSLVTLRVPRRSRPLSVATYSPDPKPRKTDPESSIFSGPALAQINLPAENPFKTKRGFLIDFTTVSTGQANYTLKGDTTYWVTGDVSLSGKTILEGGAVVKFSSYTASSPVLKILDEFECNTAPYNVAIFTAKDDDTVGQAISGSTGVPTTTSYYAWFNLWFRSASTSSVSVHDIQSRYSHVGICFKYGLCFGYDPQSYGSKGPGCSGYRISLRAT